MKNFDVDMSLVHKDLSSTPQNSKQVNPQKQKRKNQNKDLVNQFDHSRNDQTGPPNLH